MITVQNLGVTLGGKTLFENVSLRLDTGKRYGLVGANGSGKTTFLNLLSDEETLQYGSINRPRDLSVGHLEQNHFRFEELRVIDTVISGNEQLFAALSEKESLLAAGEDAPGYGEKLGKIEEIILAEDGYSAEARAGRLLDGLGIEAEKQFVKMSSLSGGYKLRVLMARTLFQNPSVLLLDEPTNHLDIISIAWLEDYLKNHFRGMLVVISHDRHFLNSVITNILDVDFGTVTLYTGNYDDFMAAKTLIMEQRLRENAALEKKLSDMQSFVERFRAKASKARQAQSRVKQIEKIELPEIISTSRRYPALKFEQSRPSGKTVLKVEGIAKSYGSNQILNNFEFQIERGQKIALVGPNGSGKSTLIKILAGVLKPDEGDVKWGIETYPSYFAQDFREQFDNRGSAMEWLSEKLPEFSIGQVRSLLGRVLITADEAEKKVSNLSGGECSRLVLARIMAENGNVLLLDEPTNHLDLESISALEDALAEFKGSVIFVSHDKRFVSNVADTIFELTAEGLQIYSGSYDEYLEKLGHDYLSRIKQKSTSNESSGRSTQHELYLSRKERKKQQQQIKKRIEKLEVEISATESSLAKIMEKLSDSDFYQGDFSEVKKSETERDELQSALDNKMAEWEKLSEEFEALDNIEEML